jgi:predicted amidohydrolase
MGLPLTVRRHREGGSAAVASSGRDGAYSRASTAVKPTEGIQSDILPLLRPGDIVTHTYHGGADSWLDPRVRPVFQEARARGVECDVGLDRVHTSFEVARQALAAGFPRSTLAPT